MTRQGSFRGSRVPPHPREQRLRTLQLLGGAVLFLLLLGVLQAFAASGGSEEPERLGQLVFDDFDTAGADTAAVRITTAMTTYRLSQTDDGRWVMPDADGYPVAPLRLAELGNALQEMRWEAAMTNDPGKLDLLNLSDPREGGTGALLEVLGPDGRPSASLIYGVKRARPYARRPEETQAFRVSEPVPPLHDAAAWLDLGVVALADQVVRGVSLSDGSGERLVLERPRGAGPDGFQPAPQPDRSFRLVSPFQASLTGLALTRFDPVGVMRADRLATRPAGRHVTFTHDGGEIALTLYREAEGVWATVDAFEGGEGARRAQAINAAADGWAFLLAPADAANFLIRPADLVREVEGVPSQDAENGTVPESPAEAEVQQQPGAEP